MDWSAVRANYPGLKRVTQLNSCSMGSPSQATLDAMREYLDLWTTMGASAWYEIWLAEIADWRKNVAKLIGCSPGEVAWTPSVSAALGSLSGALDRQRRSGDGPWAGRSDVVVGELEFPTAVSTFGVRPDTALVWAESPDGLQVPASAYASATTAATQAIVASRVFYTTGAIQPVADIAARARKDGALCIVDDYQATGQLPLDVRRLGLDVAVGGSLKWLCGGVASGWMYVRKKLIKELEPTHAGWWANAGMFEFKTAAFRFWDDARRFEGGEVNLPSLFTSNAAVKDLLRIGARAAADRTQDLARDLTQRLEDAGLALRQHPDPALRSAIVMVPHKNPKKAVARLAKQGIIVDDRPGCVRLSPHFYNTVGENERVVAALQAA